MKYYFSLGYSGHHLGRKVIYFPDKKSVGRSYWAKKQAGPGDIEWSFDSVSRIPYARRIKPSTAKRYIKHIP